MGMYGGADISRRVRPSRGWYWAAGVIALLGLVGGGAAFALGLVSAINSIADFQQTSTEGKPLTLQLEKGKHGFYVTGRSDATGDAVAPCSLTAPTVVGASKSASTSISFDRDGRTWYWAGNVTLDATQQVTAVCDGTPFAIGDAPDAGAFAGRLGGGIAALLGLPCITITLGTIIAIVTGVRRGRSKRALQANGYGYGNPY
jgi:hypothetical protein